MNDKENSKLDKFIHKFDAHCELVKTELGEIKRGLYGDPGNKAPGLIDRQSNDEKIIADLTKRVEDIERFKKVTLIAGSGIWAATSAGIIAVYEYIFRR